MGGTQTVLGSGAGVMALVAFVLAILALGGFVFLLARQQRLLGQYQLLTQGTSGGNLEAILREHVADVRVATSRTEAVDQLARRLERDGAYHLQRLAVVRFNPFHDTGGDQSFAIALTDGHGNGAVLSSLHARDVTRVYAKPVISWESTYSLTDEEKRALHLARDQKQ